MSCKLPGDLAGQVLHSIGKGSSKKKRQIRNYEIRRKTGDECEVHDKYKIPCRQHTGVLIPAILCLPLVGKVLKSV